MQAIVHLLLFNCLLQSENIISNNIVIKCSFAISWQPSPTAVNFTDTIDTKTKINKT